jgi:hypothetical protein
MKKNFRILFESFEYLFDRRYYRFAFQKLLYALVILSVIVFVASRISQPILRNLLIILGLIGVYVLLAAIFGALSQGVYQAKFWNNDKDPAEHYKTPRQHIPAYLTLPILLLVLGILLLFIGAGMYYAGRIAILGELLVALLIVPIITIGVILLLSFVISLFLGPAMVTIGGMNGKMLLDKTLSIVKRMPIQFFVSYFFALIIASVIASSLLSLVYTVIPPVLFLGESILQARFALLLISIFAFLLPAPDPTLMAEISPSFHIAAMIIWAFAGALMAAILTPAIIYITTASIQFYALFSEQEKEIRAEEKKQEEKKAAEQPPEKEEPKTEQAEAAPEKIIIPVETTPPVESSTDETGKSIEIEIKEGNKPEENK